MGTGPMGSKELLHGDRIYGQCRAACMETGAVGSEELLLLLNAERTHGQSELLLVL